MASAKDFRRGQWLREPHPIDVSPLRQPGEQPLVVILWHRMQRTSCDLQKSGIEYVTHSYSFIMVLITTVAKHHPSPVSANESSAAV